MLQPIMHKQLGTIVMSGSLNTCKTKIRARLKLHVACPSLHTILKTERSTPQFLLTLNILLGGGGGTCNRLQNKALLLGVRVKSSIITGFALLSQGILSLTGDVHSLVVTFPPITNLRWHLTVSINYRRDLFSQSNLCTYCWMKCYVK